MFAERQLLSQLGVNNRRPRSFPGSKAVETLIELDDIEVLVHDGLDDLPYWLKESNAAVSSATLWDQDYDHPVELVRHLAFYSDGLNNALLV